MTKSIIKPQPHPATTLDYFNPLHQMDLLLQYLLAVFSNELVDTFKYKEIRSLITIKSVFFLQINFKFNINFINNDATQWPEGVYSEHNEGKVKFRCNKLT